MQNYIPKRPKRLLSLKSILEMLSRELKAFFYAFIHTITLYDKNIVPPTKQLDFENELSKEQVDQCKSFFDSSLKRREKLESKAEKLLALLLIFTPLFSALITYIFSNKTHYSSHILFLYVTLGISIFSVSIAFIAIFRSRKVGDIEEPFISAIIDYENDTIHKYSSKKEGLGYLYCSINNQVRNDHIADFVRAAEYFVLINFVFLIISVFTFVFIKTTNNDVPSVPLHTTIQSEIKNITKSIDNVSSSIKLTTSQIENIQTLIDVNTDNLKNHLDTQSELLKMISTISKQQSEITGNQTMLINKLIDNYKEITSNKTQPRH